MIDIKIEVIDNTYSKINKGLKKVYPCLSYESTKVVPSQFGTKSVVKRKPLYNIRSFKFFTGFIPRIQEYCKTNNLILEILDNKTKYIESENSPYLENYDIRSDKYNYQIKLINLMIEHQRGVILGATGTGKTILMLGLISAFPSYRVLFLSDSYTPLSQFEEDLKATKNINSNNVTISTVQSLYRKNPKTYKDKYDIILIDEVHSGFGTIGREITSIKCMYGTILKHSQAPIRLGFTATLPDTKIARLNLEGLLGPVIGNFNFKDGVEKGVIIKPTIKIKKLPKNNDLRKMSYQEVYDKGVVNNRALNRMIVEHAKSDIESGLTVLILVVQVEHGKNILRIANDLYDMNMIFVHGETDKDIREQIRHAMIDKKQKCIIATAVFKKALNIPNLGCVINGCLGKTESGLLQLVGRVVRSADGKKGGVIRDYYIPGNKYLIDHFAHRLDVYFEEEWL